MQKILSSLILISALAAAAFAQETKDGSNSTNQPVKWVRVQSETGEFSVEMPSDFVYFYDKAGFTFDDPNQSYDFNEMRMLNAATEKTVMRVEIYKVSTPKKHLRELLERDRVEGDESSESLEGYTIKQVRQNKIKDFRTKKEVEINFVCRYIASKSYLYVVSVANRGAPTPAAVRFLSSIHLSQPSTDKAIVNISSLTPLRIEQMGEIVQEGKKIETRPKEKTEEVNPVEKNGSPVFYLTRPIANYTERARRARTSGTVSLRVTFAKDGSIPSISVIESLENGLTRASFFCALRIRFIPQERENEFITVMKTVSYSFDI